MDYARIAQYYESRGEYDKAADMWAKCDKPDKAVQLYLKVCFRLDTCVDGPGVNIARYETAQCDTMYHFGGRQYVIRCL